MTDTPSPKHVFMSYSRKDEAVMRRIATFLRSQGINVWVDNEKLVPGTPIWEEEIEKAIIGAGAVIVLLSPDSKNSPWVRREISYAEDNEIRIFPILVAGNARNAIPIRLTNHQRIDVRQNEERGVNLLIAAISHPLDEEPTKEEVATQIADIDIPVLNSDELSLIRKRDSMENARDDKPAEFQKVTEKPHNKPISESLKIATSANYRETNRTKSTASYEASFYNSCFIRVIIGTVSGIVFSLLMYILDNGTQLWIAIPFLTLSCNISSLLIYPNKISYAILVVAFVSAGLIYYKLTFDPYSILGYSVLFGLPLGGLISRILYTRKIIK